MMTDTLRDQLAAALDFWQHIAGEKAGLLPTPEWLIANVPALSVPGGLDEALASEVARAIVAMFNAAGQGQRAHSQALDDALASVRRAAVIDRALELVLDAGGDVAAALETAINLEGWPDTDPEVTSDEAVAEWARRLAARLAEQRRLSPPDPDAPFMDPDAAALMPHVVAEQREHRSSGWREAAKRLHETGDDEPYAEQGEQG